MYDRNEKIAGKQCREFFVSDARVLYALEK